MFGTRSRSFLSLPPRLRRIALFRALGFRHKENQWADGRQSGSGGSAPTSAASTPIDGRARPRGCRARTGSRRPTDSSPRCRRAGASGAPPAWRCPRCGMRLSARFSIGAPAGYPSVISGTQPCTGHTRFPKEFNGRGACAAPARPGTYADAGRRRAGLRALRRRDDGASQVRRSCLGGGVLGDGGLRQQLPRLERLGRRRRVHRLRAADPRGGRGHAGSAPSPVTGARDVTTCPNRLPIPSRS
jgi:hypothetical protein